MDAIDESPTAQNSSGRRRLADWFTDDSRRTLLVGEVGQAHDGSLGTAHAFIEVIANAGFDAVKFQTHIAAAESTPEEPWRVRFSRQDERRIDYWKRMEFSAEQWAGLKDHVEDRGLIFLSSPFSIEAVDLLEGLGIEGWKIASGELGHTRMLERIRSTGKPVLLSTGMSDWDEIDRVVHFLRDGPDAGPLAIFQCTSSYPCPPEKIGLNLVSELASRYDCASGLSDHSGTIFPTLAGVALGMQMAEVHVTLSREAFGPDVPASLLPEEITQLARGVRMIEAMLRHPVDKSVAAAEMSGMRELFNRSLVATRDLEAGHELTAEDLAAKKPGTGLAPRHEPELVGRRLERSLRRDEQIALRDVGEPGSDDESGAPQ